MMPKIDTIRRSLMDTPDNASLLHSLAQLLIESAWGDASVWKAHYAEATAIYHSLFENDPENGVILVNLGAVLSDQGSHEQALEYYRRAETLDWADANLDYNMGVALINLGNESLGVKYLELANQKSRNPKTIQAYFDPQAY